jgi:hypothetical protein
MTDARSAWKETGDQLAALGAKLGRHYEQQSATEGRQAQMETEEAIKRLGAAVQDAFEAVAAAARDEAVRQDVKQVGRSLVGALDVTFQEVSDQVRTTLKRAPETSETPQTPETSETPKTPETPETPSDQAPGGPGEPPRD